MVEVEVDGFLLPDKVTTRITTTTTTTTTASRENDALPPRPFAPATFLLSEISRHWVPFVSCCCLATEERPWREGCYPYSLPGESALML